MRSTQRYKEIVHDYCFLTLHHAILTFENPKEGGFGKHRGKKEKMLDTSIFSFFPRVFYPIKERNHNYTTATFNLLSANAFNFVLSKTLSFDKGFNQFFSTLSTMILQSNHTVKPVFRDLRREVKNVVSYSR